MVTKKEKLKEDLYEIFVLIGFEEYFLEYSPEDANSKRLIDGQVVGELNDIEIFFQAVFNNSHKRIESLTDSIIMLENKKNIDFIKKEINKLKTIRSISDQLLNISINKRFGKSGYTATVVEGTKVQLKLSRE